VPKRFYAHKKTQNKVYEMKKNCIIDGQFCYSNYGCGVCKKLERELKRRGEL
jgi:hypothetical protein